MLLPDLTPWASQEHGFVYDWGVQGNQLRLTTAVTNSGQGRLELRGGAINGESQDVYQRIYQNDGSFTDVLAGSFIHHPEHGHIHFENFAAYRLRQVLPDGGVGDVVAAGEKVSFCLLDVERNAATGPSSPYFLTCGQVQGISVGWADVYDRGLPGQSIDITGIADGQYWLEVVVDPTNLIRESDETNNTTRIQINLQRPVGGGPIAADAFESNNDFANASILAPPEDHTYQGLSIHQSGNDDYFRVTASATGELAFSLQFLNANGDIDLEIYDSTRTLVGSSESETNSERVSVDATAGEYYYVRAYGYSGAVNSNYTLLVDQADHHLSSVPTTGDDSVVGTNSADRVSLLAGNDTYQGLGGNDVIFGNAGNDQLDGGAGSDAMTGGTGNDVYIVDVTADRVIEYTNQGLDKVLSSITYRLGSHVENLELTGTANINGTGNTSANVIIGNSGANTLNGMTGRDVITGGDGADRFTFNTSLNSTTNVDTITDFQLGLDKIVLENAIFSRVGAVGALSSGAFVIGTAAQDTTDRIIYDDLSGMLYYDSNGTSSGGRVQFAVLDAGLALRSTDFLII